MIQEAISSFQSLLTATWPDIPPGSFAHQVQMSRRNWVSEIATLVNGAPETALPLVVLGVGEVSRADWAIDHLYYRLPLRVIVIAMESGPDAQAAVIARLETLRDAIVASSDAYFQLAEEVPRVNVGTDTAAAVAISQGQIPCVVGELSVSLLIG